MLCLGGVVFSDIRNSLFFEHTKYIPLTVFTSDIKVKDILFFVKQQSNTCTGVL